MPAGKQLIDHDSNRLSDMFTIADCNLLFAAAARCEPRFALESAPSPLSGKLPPFAVFPENRFPSAALLSLSSDRMPFNPASLGSRSTIPLSGPGGNNSEATGRHSRPFDL
jgi:hypothetical protein